tara:strand:+ start:19971 stop:20180 length:210 start_codon:yes stop_codon:yes gene_type:complete
MATKVTASKPAEVAHKYEMRAHILMNKTPQQIDNYIANNINDLASAKVLLKLLTQAVAMLLREAREDDS